MSTKEIKVEIELPAVIYCPIGCYILFDGEEYTVNTVPNVTAGNKHEYKYTITFESVLYKLYDKRLKHLKNKTFQYYGSPAGYAQLIVDNINEIDSGWSVGTCDAAPEKTIDFDGHTCRTALDTAAEAFGFEWDLNGKTLRFVKQVGNLTAYVFERGMNKGLYTLSYEYQSDKNIVTRAFGYGSSRNLPEGYRGGATQLMFNELSLDKNINLYRIKEGDYVNEDIYPRVNGLVSAISAFNADAGSFMITDSSLNFNLKDYFSSETAKISFLTGELQGQEFEILDYDNTSKTIKVKVFIDGSNNKLPNVAFQPHIGDTYTLFDMFLPAERVTAAEALLKAATQTWLDENSIPRVLYSLEIDPLYARDNAIMLEPGDKVTVKDTELGIDSLIRVTGVNYPVNFPAVITPETKITVQIANFIPYTQTERVISATIDNQTDIKIVNRTNAEKARMNSLNMRTLQTRIFNPDGTLFTGPNSIVAGMAAFGYDSQNFNLNDVTISPNNGANPNNLIISSGTLEHYVYKIDGLGYRWAMSAHSWTGLNPAKFYYVYAKCNKGVLTGTWEISETPIAVNDIPGYFAFNLGILYEVNTNGYRIFQSTKGVTTIVGDQITTGEISSLDGATRFNLNTGVIQGRIQFQSGSGGYNNIADKPDLSGLASTSFVNAIKDSLQNQIDGQITSWFYDYQPTLSNAPASAWSTDGVRDTHLGDLFYWTSKGYAYRYSKSSGVYSWLAIADTDIVLALQRAAQAQDTADGKRRVFTHLPTAPYDIGDLWAEGPASDLKVCITARPAGANFIQSDFILATRYTDDTVANQAIANAAAAVSFVNAVRDSLQNQIDGQITSWFYDYEPNLGNAPATAWGNDGVRDTHLGDLFYWTSKGYAYRYAKNTGSGAYSWLQISDTDIVLALQTANEAKDTADGKRRVFTTTPVSPYDVGDLWAGGVTADLKMCTVARLEGQPYNSSDWVLATKYTDDTVANQASLDAAAAILNAANAQSTANRAAQVTDGLVTIIDGNLVATGTLLVGDATHVNAGLTGVTDNGVNSIRFWAGAIYANRATAPFRVTDNGSVTVQSALTGKRIVIDGANNNLSFFDASNQTQVEINTEIAIDFIIPGGPGQPPVFTYGPGMKIGDEGSNYVTIGRLGIYSNGKAQFDTGFFQNLTAAQSLTTANLVLGNGNITNNGTVVPVNYSINYRGGDSSLRHMTFKNGLLMSDAAGGV